VFRHVHANLSHAPSHVRKRSACKACLCPACGRAGMVKAGGGRGKVRAESLRAVQVRWWWESAPFPATQNGASARRDERQKGVWGGSALPRPKARASVKA